MDGTGAVNTPDMLPVTGRWTVVGDFTAFLKGNSIPLFHFIKRLNWKSYPHFAHTQQPGVDRCLRVNSVLWPNWLRSNMISRLAVSLFKCPARAWRPGTAFERWTLQTPI